MYTFEITARPKRFVIVAEAGIVLLRLQMHTIFDRSKVCSTPKYQALYSLIEMHPLNVFRKHNDGSTAKRVTYLLCADPKHSETRCGLVSKKSFITHLILACMFHRYSRILKRKTLHSNCGLLLFYQFFFAMVFYYLWRLCINLGEWDFTINSIMLKFSLTY